jgi:hypothetical protein
MEESTCPSGQSLYVATYLRERLDAISADPYTELSPHQSAPTAVCLCAQKELLKSFRGSMGRGKSMAFGWINLRSGDRISLIRSFPFFAVHLACVAAFFL